MIVMCHLALILADCWTEAHRATPQNSQSAKTPCFVCNSDCATWQRPFLLPVGQLGEGGGRMGCGWEGADLAKEKCIFRWKWWLIFWPLLLPPGANRETIWAIGVWWRWIGQVPGCREGGQDMSCSPSHTCSLVFRSTGKSEKALGKGGSRKTQEEASSYIWKNSPCIPGEVPQRRCFSLCWVTPATRMDQAVGTWATAKCIVTSDSISASREGALCSPHHPCWEGECVPIVAYWQRVVTTAVGPAALASLPIPRLSMQGGSPGLCPSCSPGQLWELCIPLCVPTCRETSAETGTYECAMQSAALPGVNQ